MRTLTPVAEETVMFNWLFGISDKDNEQQRQIEHHALQVLAKLNESMRPYDSEPASAETHSVLCSELTRLNSLLGKLEDQHLTPIDYYEFLDAFLKRKDQEGFASQVSETVSTPLGKAMVLGLSYEAELQQNGQHHDGINLGLDVRLLTKNTIAILNQAAKENSHSEKGTG